MVWPILLASGASYAINIAEAYEKRQISRQEYEEGLKALEDFEAKLRTLRPDETWEDLEPKLLGEMAKFSPEIAAFVQENAPELIKEPQSQTEKQVQRAALQKYAAMAETGRDVISEAQREQALFEADARAKERQRALIEGLRQRGQLGGGAELAARLGSEQAEAVAARQAALQGVQEAEMRRRQALGQAANLAGQIRGQNLNVESANVGTMNAYNQRLANAKNMYNQYASNVRNQAQMINQQREIERQRYNLGLENQYAMFNRQQADAAKERARQFDVDLARTGYEGRSGLRAGKFQADRQYLADKSSALNTAVGVGLGVSSALTNAGYFDQPGGGTGSLSVTPSAGGQQPLGLGIDTSMPSYQPSFDYTQPVQDFSFTDQSIPYQAKTRNAYNLGVNSKPVSLYPQEQYDTSGILFNQSRYR